VGAEDGIGGILAQEGITLAMRPGTTDLAGVGVGTLYRHFPRRSDLIVAVLQHEGGGQAECGVVVAGGPVGDLRVFLGL
jgi:hypothetical protein